VGDHITANISSINDKPEADSPPAEQKKTTNPPDDKYNNYHTAPHNTSLFKA
jgi:hypothetical protein